MVVGGGGGGAVAAASSAAAVVDDGAGSDDVFARFEQDAEAARGPGYKAAAVEASLSRAASSGAMIATTDGKERPCTAGTSRHGGERSRHGPRGFG